MCVTRRAGSSFCWDAQEAHCYNTIQAIDADSTDSSSYVSDALQEQLIAADHWGNTALHAACYNSPPADLIHAILVAAS
eukprot:8772467-Ditylum_brightwellii.AAC.1